MKMISKFLSALAALAALAFAAPAMAYTDCSGTVYVVWHETGSSAHSYAQLNNSTSVGFDLPVTDAGYAGVFATIHQARAMGQTVYFRFAANGVSCTTYAWRTDLQSVYAY